MHCWNVCDEISVTHYCNEVCDEELFHRLFHRLLNEVWSLWKCVDVLFINCFISCDEIVVKVLFINCFISCDEIVVKVLFINWIEELKLGWRVMKSLLNKVVIRCVKWMVKECHSICWTRSFPKIMWWIEDVLKNCWRNVS